MDQDTHHVAQSIHVSEGGEENSVETTSHRKDPVTYEKKERIGWPKAMEKKAWQRFEDEVDMVARIIEAGTVHRKI